MTPADECALVELAKRELGGEDPSHDFGHALRVMKLVKRLASREGGDLDVLVPAALFHDCVKYPKSDPRSAGTSVESAEVAGNLLLALTWYPQVKIAAVKMAIANCSFSKNLKKTALEEFLLQDADLLESMGAISIARTFSSSGQMRRTFYDLDDPRAERRILDPQNYAMDLFGARLFKAGGRLHTDTARLLANRRLRFLRAFEAEFFLDVECEQ